VVAAAEQQAHPLSYYAASAHAQPENPALHGSQEADVCVVGAGFTGISTALTLAERGYRVAVLEANRVGWGASGRNGGQLIGGISGEGRLAARYGEAFAELLWAMRWRGNEIIRERVARYSIDCDLKDGYIDVALKPRHMNGLREDYEQLSARGFPHEFRMVDQLEVTQLLGTSHYIGGLLNMGNGHLHPLNLCLGEARAAAELGVRIFEGSTATRIEHGRRPRVVTERGSITADSVVLAGNAYHSLERDKLAGLIFPAGSFIIATAPLDPALVEQINPRDLAVCDPNHVLDYYRLSADKRMLFGGRCNYSGRTPASISATMAPRMRKIYPQLSGTPIDYEWGGHIGIVITRIPLMGRTARNVFYAQGYSGHGVNVSHLAGEIMADAVAGTLERLDVFERVKHFRIPLGQWAGSQLVALGMIYFRLRDLL
jgi:glycine/D-amino acid oxidase-like deaminating enzyme